MRNEGVHDGGGQNHAHKLGPQTGAMYQYVLLTVIFSKIIGRSSSNIELEGTQCRQPRIYETPLQSWRCWIAFPLSGTVSPRPNP